MKVFSLNIGVSNCDAKHYQNRLVPLPCCTTDAKAMNGIAHLFGYDKISILLNEEATVQNVKDKITEYSRDAKKDDLVVITYSGHGSRVPDMNFDEDKGTDQTWCLYDRMIIDDEFRHLWKKFNKGVNVLLIIDSCHSGTAFKAAKDKEKEIPIVYSEKVKSFNGNMAFGIFNSHPSLYKPISTSQLVKDSEIKCSLQTFSACHDNEEALAQPFLSFFTMLLLRTLSTKHEEIANLEDLMNLVKEESKRLKSINPQSKKFGNSTTYFENNRPFAKAGHEFPDGIADLYSNLIFGDISVVTKGMQGDGLIIDVMGDTYEDSFFNDKSKIVKKGPKNSYLVEDKVISKSLKHAWDQAHHYYDELKSIGIFAYVEPNIIPYDNTPKGSKNKSKNDYLYTWPKPIGEEDLFTWYFRDSHSQLASARDFVSQNIDEENLKIKIGHIDTGYSPHHPAVPKNVHNGISFVKGEEGDAAFEKASGKMVEQEDHGTATMSILAGKEIPDELFFGTGSKIFGAIPFADVFPMRVSETVALSLILKNSFPFARAIDKAIEEKCEVITISMGGIPVRAWAKAINRAYEAGITIVAAAGNSWIKGGARVAPKKLLYPARFARVIAACGVCYNHYPYVAKANPGFSLNKAAGGTYMQGNYKPKTAMNNAIAAYTPNTTWASFASDKKEEALMLKNGGGTSSATPQVAAAAALWIVKNKDELVKKGYAGTWKQVEAVKHALFTSALKGNIIEWKKYYGNGILKARAALDVPVPAESILKKSRKARVTAGILKFLQLVVLRKSVGIPVDEKDETKSEMILQEILQVLEQDPSLHEMYEDVDLLEMIENDTLSKEQFRKLGRQIALSPYSSEYLRSILF